MPNKPTPHNKTDKTIDDIFYLVKQETGAVFDDNELEQLSEGFLDSTRIVPMDIKIVEAARRMHELKSTNSYVVMALVIKKMEQMMY